MYIYADESGHTGQHIFKHPPYYYQGAILSECELDPILQPLVDQYRTKLKLEQLHANLLTPSQNAEIADSLIETLTGLKWSFKLTSIEKRYLAPTKFVDTVFDPHENPQVPPDWYQREDFRHALCCLFDDILTLNNDMKPFWIAFLQNDFISLESIVRRARDRAHFYNENRVLLRVAIEESCSLIIEVEIPKASSDTNHVIIKRLFMVAKAMDKNIVTLQAANGIFN